MLDIKRAPVVTDIDRNWALAQCPAWAVRDLAGHPGDDAGEIVDETDHERAQRSRRERARKDTFVWDWFVDDQIANFERFFAHERKGTGDWSRLWRLSWWPKADPHKGLTRSARKSVPSLPHPFARRGTAAFEAGIAAASPRERRLFETVGIVQFTPDDPRAKLLRNPGGDQ